jgi:hypothetical protein
VGLLVELEPGATPGLSPLLGGRKVDLAYRWRPRPLFPRQFGSLWAACCRTGLRMRLPCATARRPVRFACRGKRDEQALGRAYELCQRGRAAGAAPVRPRIARNCRDMNELNQRSAIGCVRERAPVSVIAQIASGIA